MDYPGTRIQEQVIVPAIVFSAWVVRISAGGTECTTENRQANVMYARIL